MFPTLASLESGRAVGPAHRTDSQLRALMHECAGAPLTPLFLLAGGHIDAPAGARAEPHEIAPNQYSKLVGMDIEDIGAFEAKTRLSELLEQVSRGRVYRITRRGRPVAELRPVQAGTGRPAFGADRGRIEMREDFDAPIDDMKAYR